MVGTRADPSLAKGSTKPGYDKCIRKPFPGCPAHQSSGADMGLPWAARGCDVVLTPTDPSLAPCPVWRPVAKDHCPGSYTALRLLLHKIMCIYALMWSIQEIKVCFATSSTS